MIVLPIIPAADPAEDLSERDIARLEAMWGLPGSDGPLIASLNAGKAWANILRRVLTAALPALGLAVAVAQLVKWIAL
ncbi:hypothetical protein ACLIMP_04345 [Novosphingobium aerophilum]|uniref:hypothetical protein n=1 Tax=Novosphingobium aerophilum TaxID=2839843 RepID=UPI00163D883D